MRPVSFIKRRIVSWKTLVVGGGVDSDKRRVGEKILVASALFDYLRKFSR